MATRLLADENLPKSVVTWLRSQGHDIISAQDAGLAGATDFRIAQWSFGNGRMIITLDQDFIRIFHQLGKSPGIILVRTHPPTPERINNLLSISLQRVRLDEHLNDLIIVSDRGIRIGSH